MKTIVVPASIRFLVGKKFALYLIITGDMYQRPWYKATVVRGKGNELD